MQLVAIKIARMTGVALSFHMRAAKWKFGLVVIKFGALPFILIVTGLAFRAITAPVNVLKTVAGIAGLSEILVNFSDVTCCASNFLVRAFKGKFGFAVIIWFGVAPFYNGVARFAFLETTFVRIISFMAIETH